MFEFYVDDMMGVSEKDILMELSFYIFIMNIIYIGDEECLFV